jgi:hypothetical protein
MRHLKIYENFQAAPLPNFNRLFASPTWQERFAILGVYPEYYKYHMKKMGPGTYEKDTEENDTVVFEPARSDLPAEAFHTPYQVLLHIVRQARYRDRSGKSSITFHTVPGFEVRRTEQPGFKTEGLRKDTRGPVLLKGNDSDISRLEDTIIQAYLTYLWQTAGQFSKTNNVTKAAQLVSDVLVGKLDYEQAVQRVAKYLAQISEPVDGDIYRMLKLVPPNYGKEMLVAHGYTPQEAEDLLMVDDYTELF